MIARRGLLPRAEDFAHEAVRKKGGEPIVAMGKMDTQEGWAPTLLTPWGKQHIGSIEEAQYLASQLDEVADKKARGEIWKKLNLGTGRWQNIENPSARLKVRRSVPAR